MTESTLSNGGKRDGDKEESHQEKGHQEESHQEKGCTKEKEVILLVSFFYKSLGPMPGAFVFLNGCRVGFDLGRDFGRKRRAIEDPTCINLHQISSYGKPDSRFFR